MAQDTTRVLFLGNSFTGANNLPELFKQLAIRSGKPVYINAHTPGGISVGDIDQGSSAHMNNPWVFSLIRSQKWDYLVLQDNQGRFCLGYGRFPSSSRVMEGHLKIRDSLLHYNPCGHMIWYTGFGPKNGYPPYGNTGAALIDSIYQNYQFLNAQAHEIIAPIGAAFKQIMLHQPSIELWDQDETHPSKKGSYLAAGVIYTSIFKSSPSESSYNPGLLNSEDSILKQTAYSTTADSLKKTGLQWFTPDISMINNRLVVDEGSSCNWYFNNEPVSNLQNCILRIVEPGSYYVFTNSYNGCKQRSFNLNVTEVAGQKEEDVHVYPNPAISVLYIDVNLPINLPLRMKCFHASGAFLKDVLITRYHQEISISDLSAGIYFIQFQLFGKRIIKKLLVR